MLTRPMQAGAAQADRTPVIERVLRVEWLGQTVASVCWLVSVFASGVSSTGDWLQVAAALAWLTANVAAPRR